MIERVPLSTVHGFPRIGSRRELKSAVESYWAGLSSDDELGSVAAELRAAHWGVMAEAGIDLIPCNDFSLYDHALDAAVLVGDARPLSTGAPVTARPVLRDGQRPRRR